MKQGKSLMALAGVAMAALAACNQLRRCSGPRKTRYKAEIGDDLGAHWIGFDADSPLEALAYARSQCFSPSEVVEKILDISRQSEVYRYGAGFSLPTGYKHE